MTFLGFRRLLSAILMMTLCFGLQNAQADLILTINQGTKTFFFGESDSTIESLSGANNKKAFWTLGTTASGEDQVSIASGLDLVADPPSSATLDVAGGTGITITMEFSKASNPKTVGGDPSSVFSYAGFSAANITYLESLTTGTLIPTALGTGGQAIRINVIPVPEPSSWVLGILLSAPFICRRSRRATRLLR